MPSNGIHEIDYVVNLTTEQNTNTKKNCLMQRQNLAVVHETDTLLNLLVQWKGKLDFLEISWAKQKKAVGVLEWHIDSEGIQIKSPKGLTCDLLKHGSA